MGIECVIFNRPDVMSCVAAQQRPAALRENRDSRLSIHRSTATLEFRPSGQGEDIVFPTWVRKLSNRTGAFGERLIRRVALGASLVSLVSTQTSAEPRVPVRPTAELMPDVEARKLGGKYVLQRARKGLRVIFAQHRSHSSHSSHSSHASHSSSSHYSGSHYSSSTPTPTPTPSPQPVYVPPAAEPPKPEETASFVERFDDAQQVTARWRTGLLIHPLDEYDRTLPISQIDGVLQVMPRGAVTGKHFLGYVSRRQFDLTKSRISVEVVQVPKGGAVATFAVGTDPMHWIRFRANASDLVFESRSGSEHSETKIAYNARRHRFWRFHRSADSGAVVWETSAEGKTWHVQHAAEVSFPLDAIRVELAAGTTASVMSPGRAAFDNVEVNSK